MNRTPDQILKLELIFVLLKLDLIYRPFWYTTVKYLPMNILSRTELRINYLKHWIYMTREISNSLWKDCKDKGYVYTLQFKLCILDDESYVLYPYLVINSFPILDCYYNIKDVSFLTNYFKENPLPLPNNSFILPNTTFTIFALEPILIAKPPVLCGLNPTTSKGKEFFNALYIFVPFTKRCTYKFKEEDLKFFIYQLLKNYLDYNFPLPINCGNFVSDNNSNNTFFITILINKKYRSEYIEKFKTP